MKLVQQRLLRGPNRHAPVPCLCALIDLEEAGGLQPTVQDADELLLLAWVALHSIVGEPDGVARIEAGVEGPHQRRLIVSCDIEHVAQAALMLAFDLVQAMLTEQPFDLAQPLAALHARALRHQLSPATCQVREQALAAGIPVRRVSEHAALLQLGWGSRQWRYLEGASGALLLGHSIARERQLTRALLDEAAIGMPQGAMADSVQDACRIAERIGAPVWVRPLDPARDPDIACAAVAREGSAAVTLGFAACAAGNTGARAMVELARAPAVVTVAVRGAALASDAPPALGALALRA